MNAALNDVAAALAEPTDVPLDGKAYDEETSREHALEHCNRKFAALKADQRVEWALENLPGHHVLTSSFGAQAAVSLHLVTQVSPNIPVVLIDTGYLFPETYRFIDELTAHMKLNLKVYRAQRSAAWQVLERPLDALVGLQRSELAIAVLERMLAARFLVVRLGVDGGRHRIVEGGGDVVQCCVHTKAPRSQIRKAKSSGIGVGVLRGTVSAGLGNVNG